MRAQLSPASAAIVAIMASCMAVSAAEKWVCAIPIMGSEAGAELSAIGAEGRSAAGLHAAAVKISAEQPAASTDQLMAIGLFMGVLRLERTPDNSGDQTEKLGKARRRAGFTVCCASIEAERQYIPNPDLP